MTDADEGRDSGQLNVVARDFALLSASLAGEDGQVVRPDRLVQLAVASIPHAQHCGVTLVPKSGRPKTVVATGSVPQTVDALQYATGEGPCLQASRSVEAALVADLADDRRWPRFAKRCVAETPVRSMLSVRLPLGGSDHAAMNLYSSQRSAFDESDVTLASMLSPFAAVSVEGLLRAADAANFAAALSTSRQIGTAVGVLMARQNITAEQAFDSLRQASSLLNRRLRDLAEEVTYTGRLPALPERQGKPPS